MPIKIPDALPAAETLRAENIFVMTESRAAHQDIRPLSILILNLMPKKIETETQILRKLSNSPLQVSISLLRIDDHVSKNTPQSHIESFYLDFDQVKDRYYDGMIITGAPLDFVEFRDVTYWDTVCEIMEWSRTHVTSTFFLCWAVQAALKVFYGIERIHGEDKLSGIYRHRTMCPEEPLVRGFDSEFWAPQSRYARFPIDVVRSRTDLKILAGSDEVGVYLAVSPDRRQIFVTGHSEYDPDTLRNEYFRDLAAGINPNIPVNYFKNDDPNEEPVVTWRSHGSLLYSNWLNYYVYQMTPYELGSQA